MPPPGAEDPNLFAGLRFDTIRRAIAIYLDIAYPGVEPPAAVRRRLDWPADLDMGRLVRNPPFERVGRTPDDQPIYGLRLGNVRYPHMKLQLQPWDAKDGFLLSVNTHDHALALDPSGPDVAAFRQLQAENHRLKLAIEQAWDENELPTFPRYLRDYLAQQAAAADATPEQSRREGLGIDSDDPACC